MTAPIRFICRTLVDFDEMLLGLSSAKKLFLCGAGTLGRRTLALLKERSVDVAFFIDNDTAKTRVDGISVISMREFAEHHGDGEILISCTNYGEIVEIIKEHKKESLLRGIVSALLPMQENNFDEVCRLEPDGRVGLPLLEVDIIAACNLKCDFCAFFCQTRKGGASAAEVSVWLGHWSKKINPKTVRILGGEPLLHPELKEILLKTRESWPDSDILLITNGLLLETVRNSVLDMLNKTKTCVHVSKHLDAEEFDAKLERGVERLEKYDIPFLQISAHEQWELYYQVDEAGFPQPFHSDAALAFAACHQKNCFTLYKNRFHRCSFLVNAKAAYEEGKLNSSWRFLENETFLDSQSLPSEILEHVRSGPFPSCVMCPERIWATIASATTN